MEAMIDDRNTADVEIHVPEREAIPSALSDAMQRDRSDEARFPRYRKRIIYAHSNILRMRSSYFRAMLGSDWAEGGTEEADTRTGVRRRLHSVFITDFEFSTVYWLIRYLYTNESALRASPWCLIRSPRTHAIRRRAQSCSSRGTTCVRCRRTGCLRAHSIGSAGSFKKSRSTYLTRHR